MIPEVFSVKGKKSTVSRNGALFNLFYNLVTTRQIPRSGLKSKPEPSKPGFFTLKAL
jgi:hypothetical protein